MAIFALIVTVYLSGVAESSYCRSRNMYDWYIEYFKREKPTNTLWPIVLDADDIMTNPELVRHYAKLIGLDPTKLKFTWAPGTTPKLDGAPETMASLMTTTISASAGIVEGKTSAGMDLDTKMSQWKVEFGEEEGIKLDKLVRAAMPDYEYMLSRKLTL